LGEPESRYMHVVPIKRVRVMGPRPEGHDLAGKPHRLAPADGLVGDGNVGVDEAVSQLGLTQVTVHWLFPCSTTCTACCVQSHMLTSQRMIL